MWGGTAQRNMTSAMKNLPELWDVKAGKNIKWKAQIGSTSYGNPVVADGKIFLGTNNGNPKNPEIKGDKGVLMCFRESDGKFLWQAVTDKLDSGSENDWPEQGVCSSPAVEGKRLYYVSNRGELICLDTEGFMDGKNDGPFQDEVHKGPADADIIWKLDMMKELGVIQLYMANSSPVIWEDLVFHRDLQRPRWQRREDPCAESSQLYRRQQRYRQGRVAGQFSGRRHPARPVVLPGSRPGGRGSAGVFPGR